jgi:hypothetical protein
LTAERAKPIEVALLAEEQMVLGKPERLAHILSLRSSAKN